MGLHQLSFAPCGMLYVEAEQEQGPGAHSALYEAQFGYKKKLICLAHMGSLNNF